MGIKIQYTNDRRAFNGVKCLAYGRSGAGKTRLAATAPNPIVLSAESGLLSLRHDRVPFIEIGSYKDLVEAHEWATKSSDAKKFDTIGLDSVSEIAEVVLAEEKAKSKDPRKAYGELSTSMIALLRDFRDLPQKHVYFIAKEEMYDNNGYKTARPSFPGQQLANQMPYFFDEVFQLVTWVDQANNGAIQRGLKTQTDQYSEAKDRSGALAMWEPPNLAEVFNKILRG
jgi:hypothetical protein